jgi:hypothetical protein
VYTPAHESIHSGEKLFIDLNHDGINDVTIREIPYFRTCCYPSNSVQAVPAPGAAIQLGSFYGGAAPLPVGAPIGDGLRFYNQAVKMANVTATYGYRSGSWASVPPSYLGIRFTINGETHYGWARIDLQFEDDDYPIYVDVRLSGYAYETQPNVPIRAGDRGENGNDNDKDSGDAKLALPHTTPAGSAATLGALALGARRRG